MPARVRENSGAFSPEGGADGGEKICGGGDGGAHDAGYTGCTGCTGNTGGIDHTSGTSGTRNTNDGTHNTSDSGNTADTDGIGNPGDSRNTDAAGDIGALRSLGDAYWLAAFSGGERKRLEGSVYTPEPIIDAILDAAAPELFDDGGLAAPIRLCDPAMGCGFFFLRLIERLLRSSARGDKNAARRWAEASLHGVDRDPGSVFMTRCLLWLALSEPDVEFLSDPARFRCGDSLLGPGFGAVPGRKASAIPCPEGLDWGAAFPETAAAGGFDVVVGNPPYEVLTNFARRPERKRLADALRRAGHYRLSLSGQINLYRCFIERSLDLARPGGSLAMVVPLSLARDAAALPLRRRLLLQEGTDVWLLYGEKDRLFSGVTQSACVFRAVRDAGPAEPIAVAAGGGRALWTLRELEAVGGEDLAIPELAPEGREVWRWLERHCPGRLGDVAAMRVGEVDQTVFRDCMRDDDTGCLLARGSHLAPFRLDVAPVPGKERFLDLPAFLAKKGNAAACRERASAPRVAQLGIRNMQTLPRLVAAIAPPGVYLGNSLNVYEPLGGVSIDYLAGVLNSRILDWLFRVGSGNNNINLREMRRLPFPAAPTRGRAGRVAGAYRACAAAAEAGRDANAPREALDEAVRECYGLPGELYALMGNL